MKTLVGFIGRQASRLAGLAWSIGGGAAAAAPAPRAPQAMERVILQAEAQAEVQVQAQSGHSAPCAHKHRHGLRYLVRDFRKLVEDILTYATTPSEADQVRQWPTYIQLMGDKDASPSITRIVRRGSDCETASRDFDFSALSIARHQEEGYAAAREALAAARA